MNDDASVQRLIDEAIARSPALAGVRAELETLKRQLVAQHEDVRATARKAVDMAQQVSESHDQNRREIAAALATVAALNRQLEQQIAQIEAIATKSDEQIARAEALVAATK